MYATKSGHLLRLLGEGTPLARIDAKAVDGYIEARLAEEAARNTINKELITLRGALRVAKRRGEFTGDIDAILPVAFAPEYKPRRTALVSLDDLWALIKELPPHRGAHVAFLVATAARDSEAFRAEARDVDLARGVVYVRGTKTEASDDTIAIPPWARPLLEHVLATLGDRQGAMLRPWTSIRKDLAAACRRVGLKRKATQLDVTPYRVARLITKGEVSASEIAALFPKVTPNDLRRTHATWLRAAGIDPSLIGRQLRHRDGRMAERVYGRLAPDDLAAVLQQRLAPVGKGRSKGRR
jgi:integrase